jgi:metal-dependent amidase/aminoacylase/carboxypeptidase family protein
MLRAVAQGAETMTGATLEFHETRGYENMVTNRTIAAVFGEHLTSLGREVEEPGPSDRLGSTDMADISQIMPAVHAYLAIAPAGVANHTPAFTEQAGSPSGDAAVIDGAKALALTALDLLADPALLERAKAEYAEQLARGEVAGREAWLTHGQEFEPVQR